MTKEERAALLRKRCLPAAASRQKPPGMYRAKNPREADRRELRRTPANRELPPKIYLPWPQIIPDTKRAPGWMRVPDQREEELLEAELPSGVELMQEMAKKWLAAMSCPESRRQIST